MLKDFKPMNTSKEPPLGTHNFSRIFNIQDLYLLTSKSDYCILRQFAVDNTFSVSLVIYFVFWVKTNRVF